MTAVPNKLSSTNEMEARYQRAQTLLQGMKTNRLVRNDRLVPHWIGTSHYFWYEQALNGGKAFRLVDAKSLTHKPAFDHAALADALSQASQQEVNPNDLPLSHIAIQLQPLRVSFTAFKQHWQFDGASQHCQAIPVTTVGYAESLSPNGKLIAFTRDHNLWLRELDSGKERALTEEGEALLAYAAPGSTCGISWSGLNLQWSPDSQRLLTLQKDTRQVNTLPMVNHLPPDGSLRPQVTHTPIAYPGDSAIETYRLLAIDINTGNICSANYGAVPGSNAADWGFFTASRLGWWATDNRHAYFIDQARDAQSVRLVSFDTDTGTTQVLFEETSNTFINLKPESVDAPLHHYLADNQELIWWSERSGWGHLYLYDLTTGELKHPLTQGNWRVRDIVAIDHKRREIWLQTAGRDNTNEDSSTIERNPYWRDICRVNIDTGELSPVILSDHDYIVHSPYRDYGWLPGNASSDPICGIAPNGDYLVTTRTRIDQLPTSLLLDRNGNTLLTLENATLADLPTDWQWPEPVKTTAADGTTALYGVLFKPSDFCKEKQYPVINLIASGHGFSAVPHGSFHNGRSFGERAFFLGLALAELGFIVLVLDSRGTPLRHKAFHDTCYGWIPSSANSEDHYLTLQQLADRHPFMDLNKVGLFDLNGQGGMENLSAYPEFYRVGVVHNLQDTRLMSSLVESDKYQGIQSSLDHQQRYPEHAIEAWNGKLLLIHVMFGGVIPTNPPASTFRLVNALQAANKDFDLLLLPHADAEGSYQMRRTWDYFVTHLQESTPPTNFKLTDIVW